MSGNGGGWVRGILMVLLVAGLSGCYKHTVHAGRGAPDGRVAYDHWEHFWIAGLIGDVRVDIQEICGSPDATVRVRQSVLNGLVAGLTGGIYTPTTVEVRCRDGRRGDLDFDRDDLQAIGEDQAFQAWVAEGRPRVAP